LFAPLVVFSRTTLDRDVSIRTLGTGQSIVVFVLPPTGRQRRPVGGCCRQAAFEFRASSMTCSFRTPNFRNVAISKCKWVATFRRGWVAMFLRIRTKP